MLPGKKTIKKKNAIFDFSIFLLFLMSFGEKRKKKKI